MASILGSFAGIVQVFMIWISFYFLRNSSHMSQRTKLMQKRYLTFLCIQVSIPISTFLTPILVLVTMLGSSTHFSQGCNWKPQKSAASISAEPNMVRAAFRGGTTS
ncbi:hypothetical protein OESDEN_20855 [Oesophagostomum dentatum]|uniref:Uncharacterized protein n=1 Tax=Oesophagostomum dentatum TaxID=61180 RepID=A0A0B1S6H8_OESDE|nr:hypothetical protein OESDEN_20855 [Oesophagostomum dentatum]